MPRAWLAIVVFLTALGGFGIVSADMPQCSQRESVVGYLGKKYGEQPVALGVTSNGGLVEVLSTEGGGTWSIIATSAQGWSCLVAAGEAWKMIAASFGEES